MTKLEILVDNALGRTDHYLIRTNEDKELSKQINCKYLIFDLNNCLVGVYNNLEYILQDYK